MKPNPDKNSKHDSADITNRDDSFVRQQLELLGQPEPIDSGFRAQLSEQLDEAFAATMAGVDTALETEVDHENLLTRRQPKETNEELAPSNSSGRRFPRWLGGIIAATVLMGLLSFWLGQPYRRGRK